MIGFLSMFVVLFGLVAGAALHPACACIGVRGEPEGLFHVVSEKGGVGDEEG